MFINTFLTRKKIVAGLASIAFLIAPLLNAQQPSMPHVESFTLINADTGEDLETYPNNSEVNPLSISIGANIRISIKINTQHTASVRISGFGQPPRVENHLPFSLLGDENNIYEPWMPDSGVYNIFVEPFSANNASGDKGEKAVLNLTIARSAALSIQEPLATQDASSIVKKIMPATMYLLSGGDLINAKPKKQTVVFVGSSIVKHAFGRDLSEPHTDMMARLQANGVDNIDFYGYGFAGQTVRGILPAVNTVLTTFPDAKVAIMIGGNDVTRTRPYATRTQTQVDDFTRDIEALIARFTGIEGQLILVPLTYSSYAYPFSDDSMFVDGSSGVEPYNDNEYLPRVPESQKNIDGNHILDLFNFTRNNRFVYSGSDGIHYNRFGIDGKRQFVADRLGYLINGGERPSVVVPGGPAEPFDPNCCG